MCMQFYKNIISVLDKYDSSLTPEEFMSSIPDDVLEYIRINYDKVIHNMRRMITENKDEHYRLFTVCDLLKGYFNPIPVKSGLYNTIIRVNNESYDIKERLSVNNRDIWVLRNINEGMFIYGDFIIELTPTEIHQLNNDLKKETKYNRWYIYSDKQYRSIINIFETVYRESNQLSSTSIKIASNTSKHTMNSAVMVSN